MAMPDDHTIIDEFENVLGVTFDPAALRSATDLLWHCEIMLLRSGVWLNDIPRTVTFANSPTASCRKSSRPCQNATFTMTRPAFPASCTAQ